jgi:selenocysteine lyase/cysteine desulfurase
MTADMSTLFHPAPELTYLDAANYGLPPDPTFAAVQAALEAWRAGTGRWVEDWDRPADAARGDFASLIGARAADIALIPTVSVGMGLIAGSLKPGDEVVVPGDEHVSDLWPLLVAERRGIRVRQVAFDSLADSIRSGTSLVAFSLVQMQTGRIADLASITVRAQAVGARVFIDAAHATPFVPVAQHISRIDYLVCPAYKHLLGSRGSGFLYVREDSADGIIPTHANWRGAADPFGTFFGGPLTLAEDAARFNASLAWLPWVATTQSLRLVAGWQRDGTLDGVVGLAAQLAEAVGNRPTGSTLVCVPVGNPDSARIALETAHIKASVRGGAIRFSPHVYNTSDDITRAAKTIAPFVAARP